MKERTLSIIKPDAVEAGQAGEILSRVEKAGFKIVALQLRRLSRADAEGFYHVHRERPFFSSLCSFMSSGPCIPMVLERDDAIARLREIMGATDPAKAEANKAEERKKKEAEEIEKTYKDTLKRTTREQPAKKTDPWGSVR